MNRAAANRCLTTLLTWFAMLAGLAACASISYGIGRGKGTELRFFSWMTPTVDQACIVCPIEYALSSDETNDVIFLGDSTCRAGLDPAELERLTGLRAYNLGSLRGAGAAGFVITVKAYLLHHPKPRAVVLCVTPTCFETDSRLTGGPLPGRVAANYGPEVSEFVPVFDRFLYFSKCGASSLWPRETVGQTHGRDVRDLPLIGRPSETYRTFKRKALDARGFFPFKAVGRPNGVGGPMTTLITEEWDVGIRRLADICEEAGVAFIIRFGPVTLEIARMRDFGPLEEWSRQLEGSHRHVTIGRPLAIVYEQPLMADYVHLNAGGVKAFMPLVAHDVQAALAK